jgi:hypothetical protein
MVREKLQIWVPCVLGPRLRWAEITDVRGQKHRVAGQVGCLDGVAAILATVLSESCEEAIEVRFR